MLEQGSDQPMAKKSLLNSFELLQARLNQLLELIELSDKMVRKFQRVDNQPTNKVAVNKEEKVLTPKTPDYIDLFIDLADDFEQQIIIIGKNIERMIDWID